MTIMFGCCNGSQQQFRDIMLPGIEASTSASYPITVRHAGNPGRNTSIFPVYNQLLDMARAHPSLEALVLMHTDVELRDDCFIDRVRKALARPNVAIVGCIGARGVQGLAWWEYEKAGRARDVPHGLLDFGFDDCDVDTVDGLLLILSPWAVHHLRFDETTCPGFHGYDFDICKQAKADGKRVVVRPFELLHRTKGGYTDGVEAFRRADAAFRAKWAPKEVAA